MVSFEFLNEVSSTVRSILSKQVGSDGGGGGDVSLRSICKAIEM